MGLATEASVRLLRLAFEDWKAERVWAQTMAVNLRSRAVMERCGLRYLRTVHLDWEDPIPGTEEGDAPISMAAIRLEEYLPWCEGEQADPSAPETRAQYAAVLGTQGRVTPWPPEPNGSCWCGSGQRYRWCCGRRPA